MPIVWPLLLINKIHTSIKYWSWTRTVCCNYYYKTQTFHRGNNGENHNQQLCVGVLLLFLILYRRNMLLHLNNNNPGLSFIGLKNQALILQELKFVFYFYLEYVAKKLKTITKKKKLLCFQNIMYACFKTNRWMTLKFWNMIRENLSLHKLKISKNFKKLSI